MQRGVLGTKGHLAGNGGLRGHSVGDCFPFIVFAQGTFDSLAWKVREPSGKVQGNCKSALEASLLGNYLREAV